MRDLIFASIWRIGVIDKPVHEVRSSDFANIQWIEPDEFPMCMADPFGIICGDRRYIVFEQYDQRIKLGSIMVMEYTGEGRVGSKNQVFENQNHMSYPYSMIHDEKIYLLKEDTSLTDIVLYNMNCTKVIERITLVKNFRAVDPSLIYFNERWWLFCTNGDSLECEMLYIFYSDNLEGEWLAHAGNPVKRDISCARPAGTPFINDGILYRPGQDNSVEYGKRIVISRVVELSPDSFREEPEYFIESDSAKRYHYGTHTISKFGDMTLVDAKLRISRRKLKTRKQT